MIKVGVFGAGGRMGAAVCAAVSADPELELVAAIDPHRAGTDLAEVGVHGTGLEISVEPQTLLDAGTEVAVDFTVVDAARENLRFCAQHGVHAVVGTTGFTDAEIADLGKLFDDSSANALIAPNFAIGAVLMMRFAELAAPYFETAEIIELHHDAKIDAPSGTAVATAKRIAAASKDWADDPTTKIVAEGARGATVDGISVHSVRMRGMVAHQEVVLGTTGQSLVLRHDAYDRSSFMPGVLLAVKHVAARPGLTIGLEAILGV